MNETFYMSDQLNSTQSPSEEIESTHLWCIPWNSNLYAGTVQVQPVVTKFAEILSQKWAGAYIYKNPSNYYSLDWAYLGQKLGQNTVKDWAEHKIRFIFELSTHENRPLLGFIYKF